MNSAAAALTCTCCASISAGIAERLMLAEMSTSFEIESQRFIAFNGGPHYKLNPAISLFVSCNTQEEVDALWSRFLAEGGKESQCGWLVDRFGLSWQIVPKRLLALMTDPDPARAQRAMQAMLTMKRIDIAAVERAADGQPVR